MKTTFNSANVQNSIVYKKDKKQKNKGVIAGLFVSSFINKSPLKTSFGLNSITKMQSYCQFDEVTLNKVKDSIHQGLEKSGLKDKGVKILHLTEDRKVDAQEILDAIIPKSLKKVTSKINKIAEKQGLEDAIEMGTFTLKEIIGGIFNSGSNAMYGTYTKKIILPDKLILSGFHEMGHALNKNSSKIFNVLQIMRPMKLLVAPILLISLFNKDKVEDTKQTEGKSPVRNVAGFIKRNSGKLTFAMFLPELLEEAMASKKGMKIAKNVLKDSPELIKKSRHMFLVAYSTYLLAAGLSVLSTVAAVKVKDQIQENYEFSLKAKQK